MPPVQIVRQRPDGMDSAGLEGIPALPTETPMMKPRHLVAHHNTVRCRIVMVRKFGNFIDSQPTAHRSQQTHRIGDRSKGARA
jgi:hypothetical protein